MRLFTKDDWLNGLRPTGLRGGIKLDFINYYEKMEAERPFVGVTKDGVLGTWYPNGRHFSKQETGFDLMIGAFQKPEEAEDE